MSGALGAAGVLGGIAASVLFYVNRNIGGIIADVVMRETHHDELEITQHPVESGAAISDHAFVRPVEVTLEMGWTNASLSAMNIAGLLAGNLPSLTLDESRVRTVYATLLALQKSRAPITILTGKRTYHNMLIAGLSTETTVDTEYSLLIQATCREVIIVSTSSVSIAPQAAQAYPESTAPTVDNGTVQPAQTQSALSAIF